MNPPPRHLRVLLGCLAVLAFVSMLAADWNWARPALVHYLRQTSQREVRIDDLQVRLNAAWQPVVTLRGVHIANAPWAGPKPFAVAEEASFTFDWKSLWAMPRVITEMRLVGADVMLQRQADGLRNWRLTRPEDRGGARMRILRLATERTRLQLVHHGVGLALEASSTPLQPAQGTYRQQIDVRGEYRGTGFTASTQSGSVLSMVDTGEFFALRGEARSGDTRLQAEGRVADLLQLAGLDARLALQGESLGQLAPFLQRPAWPGSKPYRFQGRVVRQGAAWLADDVQLRIGRSDLAGHGRYSRHDERHVLNGELTSRLLHLDDLPESPAPRRVDSSATPAPAASRVLPQSPLPLDSVRSFDGRITLHAAALQGARLPTARALRARLTLAQGQLDVKLAHAEWAGATWRGDFALDAREATPKAALDLQVQGLRLQDLWPTLRHQPGVQWPALHGRVDLRGSGPSIAAWLASATGRVDLSLAGGSLSRRLDARLGLNAGGMLRALFSGDQPVPIRCGALSIAFANGQGRTRQLVLQTERTHVEGEGSLRLGEETWALVLTPQPQGGASALTVPSSVLAQGTFQSLRYRLAQREPLPRSTCQGD